MATSSPTPTFPSGAQHVIGHGRAQAIITEIGATLRSYEIAGIPVVDGFAAEELCPSGRGQVLAPWPNRLGDGRYDFGGRSGRAALDEPERGNAIHGLVRWLPWEVSAHAQNVIALGCVLHPQPGYPWRLEVEVEYRLGRDGLVVTSGVTNLDDAPAPLGVGFHPYLSVGTGAVDTTRLCIPASRVVRTDERGLPVGESHVGGTEFDFRVARPVGTTRLDTAFTGLARDASGIARVELRHPDGERGVTLWMDQAFGYLMAYTGDSLADNARRRQSLALEPMTCPPDALRSGTALVSLPPHAGWRGTWGLRPG